MPQPMRFVRVQSHNLHDCKVTYANGRISTDRHVEDRIGYIVAILGKTPTGFSSVNEIVERMNEKYPGAHYRYSDIYPQMLRAVEAKLVVHTAGGTWRLAPRGADAWKQLKQVNKQARSRK